MLVSITMPFVISVSYEHESIQDMMMIYESVFVMKKAPVKSESCVIIV